MALRIAHKINRQIVQNISRSLSAKRDTELEPILQKVEDVGKTVEPIAPPPTPVMPVQYEVCRPRTTPITPFPNSVQNETDAVKQTVALQHLQPAMLPEYYKPPTEINSACMGFDQLSESSKYRKFEDSNTFKNITVPLKGPKLASPFPEPVKVMQSHTVSDQEKAEQMLAESKSMLKSNPAATKPQKQPSLRSIPPNVRSYSTNQPNNTDKCKLGAKEVKKCVKIKVPHCAPVKSIRCGKKKKESAQCQKKPSPYPSYSETCHEDPYNKPSECKICPYRPDDHPTFKPPKSSFHTFSFQPQKAKNDRIKVTASVVRKKTPKAKFSSQAKEEASKKEAKEGKLSAKIVKTKPPSTISLSKEMGSWLGRLKPEDLLLPMNRMYEMSAVDDEKNSGKCKKFPFKDCTFTIEKQRKVTPAYNGKCPPKEKPKLVKDCPPESEDKCKRSIAVNDIVSYIMSDSNSEGTKKKCPKINLGVCKDPKDYTDDPCGRKKRGKTLICPDDLLKKKPRDKKKKTSPAMPFIEKNTSMSRIPPPINV